MGSRIAAVMNNPIYEDFEASSQLVEEKDCDTILLNLPGFRKEHLKVQLTSSKVIRISGSKPIGDNKWSRFLKEFPASHFHDTQRITAKYESGILYVRLPKLSPPKDDPKMPSSNPIIKPPLSHKISSVQEQQPSQIPRNSKEEPKADQNKDKIKGDAAKKSSEEKSIAGYKREEDDNAKKLPREEKTSNLDDDDSKKKVNQKEDKKGDAAKKSSVEKSIAGETQEEDDITKKLAREEKISNLDDDSKKKVVAESKTADDSAKKLPNNKVTSSGEKREKEGIEGSGKSRVERYKERAVDVGSKLRKDKRIFNLVMVVICALAIGLYMTTFINSFKRNDN